MSLAALAAAEYDFCDGVVYKWCLQVEYTVFNITHGGYCSCAEDTFKEERHCVQKYRVPKWVWAVADIKSGEVTSRDDLDTIEADVFGVPFEDVTTPDSDSGCCCEIYGATSFQVSSARIVPFDGDKSLTPWMIAPIVPRARKVRVRATTVTMPLRQHQKI